MRRAGRSLLLLLAAWAIVMPRPARAQETGWEIHTSAGILAYREGRYADAVSAFRAALAALPTSDPA